MSRKTEAMGPATRRSATEPSAAPTAETAGQGKGQGSGQSAGPSADQGADQGFADQLDALVTVLDLVRSGAARTRPQLVLRSGLGRSVVSQRVAYLLEAGILSERGIGRSTGGRAPRELELRADAGVVLVAPLGASHLSVGVADLSGQILTSRSLSWPIARGPDETLRAVSDLFAELLTDSAVPTAASIYGIGVGLPGPVKFSQGIPVSPPIMPGWDGFDVRHHLSAAFDAPVWVDNDVNLMALGELRAGAAQGQRDVIFVKVGTGIGAGLISRGSLHRGAEGCAGDIGHVTVGEGAGIACRCGNIGCLEALAGGAALVRDGITAAREGRSPYLAAVLEAGKEVDARDVRRAAEHGDATAVALIARSGRLVGETLATLVNFFDPSLVLLGGGVAGGGDQMLAAVRQTVYSRSLPLATRDLRILRSSMATEPALVGAAFMVVDELFSRERLGTWVAGGSPAGRPELADA